MTDSYLFRAALAAALALGAVGCGTDDPEDDSGAGGDAGVGADVGGDAGTAIAGAVNVELDPARRVYPPGTTVKGVATVYDITGSEVSNPSVTWSVEPSKSAKKAGARRFKLKEEGTLTLRACATLGGGREVCGSKEAVVDGGPPTVKITKPKPGALLGDSGSGTITVEGKVTDSHGEVSAFLGGEKLDLADDGSFSTEITPVFGVNTLRLIAGDGLNSRDTSTTRQVLWAPGYEPLTTTGSKLKLESKRGVGFNLGQNFFDDARPPTKKMSESKIVARDIADVLRLLITNIDLASQLPNPILNSSSARLEVTSVKLGKPAVIVDVVDDGLRAYLHIDQLVLQTSGQVTIEGQQLSLNGSITGRASAFVDISVDRKSSGDFETKVESLELSIDEATANFADKKANAIFELAEGTLRKKFEQQLRKTLRKQIVGVLPNLIENQFNSLETTLSQQSFEFGTSEIGKRTVTFSGEIETFETRYRDAMLGQLGTELAINGKDRKSSAPGVPLLAPNSKKIPWFEQSRLQISLRLRIINGLLSAIWKSGFLDVDLSGSLPENIGKLLDEAKLDGKLPPVVRPATETEPYDLVLEVGQVELQTKTMDQTDRYGLHVRAGIVVSLENNELKLEIPDKPTIDAWLIETTADDPFLEPKSLRQIILSKLWPSLSKSLKDGLALSLPAPDLSGLSNLSPTLKKLMVGYEIARPVTVRNGFIMLDSNLKGVLPLGN